MVTAYELYKPLRNHLRKVGVFESLGVIRAYMAHMQFGAPFPSDIEVMPFFMNARDPLDRKVFEWELDVIAREIVLNGSDGVAATETLRRWNYFSGAVNKLKTLENELVGLYPKADPREYILLEFHRIAHREFVWQKRPDRTWIARYFKVFGHPRLDAIIQRKLGLTSRELYRLGLAFTGLYRDKYVVNYPPHIDIRDLNRELLDRFLARFALDLDGLKRITIEVQQVNADYAYIANPLRMYPLVWFDNRTKIACPVPTFVLRRFTEGVYYEIRDEPDFSDAFGDAFQQYIGEVIEKSDRLKRFTAYPEAEYWVGKERKDTVDWMVGDVTGTVFVESKTKRLRLEAKTALKSRDALDAEIDKLAGFITQVYKTIRDYRDGRYPQKKYEGEPLLPVVVTLEEWYAFGDLIQVEVERRVGERLTQAGLAAAWLDELPYVTCSADDFEDAIQVIGRVGVAAFLQRRASNAEFKKWHLGSFLRQEFPTEMEEGETMFDEVLEDLAQEA